MSLHPSDDSRQPTDSKNNAPKPAARAFTRFRRSLRSLGNDRHASKCDFLAACAQAIRDRIDPDTAWAIVAGSKFARRRLLRYDHFAACWVQALEVVRQAEEQEKERLARSALNRQALAILAGQMNLTTEPNYSRVQALSLYCLGHAIPFQDFAAALGSLDKEVEGHRLLRFAWSRVQELPAWDPKATAELHALEAEQLKGTPWALPPFNSAAAAQEHAAAEIAVAERRAELQEAYAGAAGQPAWPFWSAAPGTIATEPSKDWVPWDVANAMENKRLQRREKRLSILLKFEFEFASAEREPRDCHRIPMRGLALDGSGNLWFHGMPCNGPLCPVCLRVKKGRWTEDISYGVMRMTDSHWFAGEVPASRRKAVCKRIKRQGGAYIWIRPRPGSQRVWFLATAYSPDLQEVRKAEGQREAIKRIDLFPLGCSRGVNFSRNWPRPPKEKRERKWEIRPTHPEMREEDFLKLRSLFKLTEKELRIRPEGGHRPRRTVGTQLPASWGSRLKERFLACLDQKFIPNEALVDEWMTMDALDGTNVSIISGSSRAKEPLSEPGSAAESAVAPGPAPQPGPECPAPRLESLLAELRAIVKRVRASQLGQASAALLNVLAGILAAGEACVNNRDAEAARGWDPAELLRGLIRDARRLAACPAPSG